MLTPRPLVRAPVCTLALCALSAAAQATERWTTELTPTHGGWLSAHYTRTAADVDGDGLADLVGFGHWGVSVARSTGAAFAPSEGWSGQFGNHDGWHPSRHLRLVADVDGDGRGDVVAIGEGEIYVALSDGDRFGPAQTWLVGSLTASAGWTVDRHERRLGDVDGDGRADLVGFGDDAVYVARSNGHGFDAPQVWSHGMTNASGYVPGLHARLLGDVDGDGLVDAVAFHHWGVGAMFSTGAGFGPEVPLIDDDFGYMQRGDVAIVPRIVADADGDGRADLIAIGDEGALVRLSEGRAVGQRRMAVRAFGVTQGWLPQHPRVMADLDGDGAADLIGFADETVQVALSRDDIFDNPLRPLGGGAFVTRLTQFTKGMCLSIWGAGTYQRPCDEELPYGWVIEGLDDGTHRIAQDGKCLHAESTGAGQEQVRSDASLCDDPGSAWIVERTRDGHARLRNARNAQCLQVPGATKNDGERVRTLPCDAAEDQLWRIALRPRVIHTALRVDHSGQCLDVRGGQVTQQPCVAGDLHQTFALTDNGHGALTLSDAASGQCLTLPVGGEGQPVISTPCAPWVSTEFTGQNATQLFAMQPVEGGRRLLVSRRSGRCVDIAGDAQAAGAQVIEWDCHGAPNQRWSIERMQANGALEISLQNVGGEGSTALVIAGEHSALLTRDPVAIVAFLRRSGALDGDLDALHDLLTYEQRVEFEARVGDFGAALPGDIDVSAQAIVVSADAMVGLTGASVGVGYTTVQAQVELGGVMYGEVKLLSADARISIGLDGLEFGPSANVWTGSAGFGDPSGTYAGVSSGLGTEGFRAGARWGQGGQYGVTVPLAFAAVDLYVTDGDLYSAAMFAGEMNGWVAEAAGEAFDSAWGWSTGAFDWASGAMVDLVGAIGGFFEDVGDWFSGWW